MAAGERWIVVHGASGVMNDLCAERGVAIRMVTSPSGYRSRFVGEKERELFREAALSYGARIKALLAERGVKAEQADPEQAAYAVAKRKDFQTQGLPARERQRAHKDTARQLQRNGHENRRRAADRYA